MDYRAFYHLEDYLFDTVRIRFREQGYLSAFDFFCIVIWKANRAKTKMARRLKSKGHVSLDSAVQALTSGIARKGSAKERLRYMLEEWGFYLPMASAILTVLYPEEFTVYDSRVCNQLGCFHDLYNITTFDRLWHRYLDFRQTVEKSVPGCLNLRDKDRYLWGKSFFEQLTSDVANGFARTEPVN
ncbi:MAG: hypothetical protein HY675_27265 [Chloroflexi bacterium]|nr:hypothetical protein [Chloroflexota bacterium]